MSCVGVGDLRACAVDAADGYFHVFDSYRACAGGHLSLSIVGRAGEGDAGNVLAGCHGDEVLRIHADGRSCVVVLRSIGVLTGAEGQLRAVGEGYLGDLLSILVTLCAEVNAHVALGIATRSDAATLASIAVERDEPVLLAGKFWGVTVIIHYLAADNHLVAYLNLRVAIDPRLVVEVLAAVGNKLLVAGIAIVGDVEGGCAILCAEGVLDAYNLTLHIVVFA